MRPRISLLRISLYIVFLAMLFLLERHSAVRLSQAAATVRGLEQRNRALLSENQFLHYVNELALEFSMDPLIVMLVDHYSREYLKQNGPEWRLLRTPEFTTFIMLSLIHAESRGNPSAEGDGGRARGLTQIWASTAQDYGEVTPEKLLEPETNIAFSFKHFHFLLKKYRGNLALVLYAWNRGHGTTDKLLFYGQSPENGYAKKVYEAALVNNRQLMAKIDPERRDAGKNLTGPGASNGGAHRDHLNIRRQLIGNAVKGADKQ